MSASVEQTEEAKTIALIASTAYTELPKTVYNRLFIALHSRDGLWMQTCVSPHEYGLLTTVYECLVTLRSIWEKTNRQNPYFKAALILIHSFDIFEGNNIPSAQEDYEQVIRHVGPINFPKPDFTRESWKRFRRDYDTLVRGPL
jgi:hypothetical protein